MTTSATIQSPGFLEAFESLDPSSPIHALRARAFASFSELGFPTMRDEAWRYTNIKSLAKTAFVAAPVVSDLTHADIAAHELKETPCHQLVFVNGRYVENLSSVSDLEDGVTLKNLAEVLQNDFASIEGRLGSISEIDREAFTALNTAFITDGVVIRVPKGVKVTKPIHLLFVTVPCPGAGAGDEVVICQPRILIEAEANAQVTIIESYAGVGDGAYFTNTVTEIFAAENASIDHYKIERDHEQAYHISSLNVKQERSSHVTSHNYSFGGKLVRNHINCALDGEGCETTFNGLVLGHNAQHVDNHLRIDHNQPNCNSWEFYKTILDDRARGVFAGRIYVAPDAQKTDAKQTSMSLLLSGEANVTTMPQLEIFADDVKCTHGATIGQLEETQLFYLQARGIDKVAAKRMLIYAFANETISEIKVEELRARLEKDLMDRLSGSESGGENC